MSQAAKADTMPAAGLEGVSLTLPEQMLYWFHIDARPPLKLLCAALWADDLWSTELVRLYGRRSGDARYDERGRGEAGSVLREIYDLRQAATAGLDAFHASVRTARVA